jgi:flagellar capping protein FliD
MIYLYEMDDLTIYISLDNFTVYDDMEEFVSAYNYIYMKMITLNFQRDVHISLN